MVKLALSVGLIGCMVGYSMVYWLQAAVIDHVTLDNDVEVYLPLGVKNDKVTFGFCVLTSLLGFVAICLAGLRETNKIFAFMAIGIVVLLLILWIAAVIVYARRVAIDDSEVKDLFKSIFGRGIGRLGYSMKAYNMEKAESYPEDFHYRKYDIVRGVVMVIFALASLVMLFLSGLHKH